MLFGHGIKIILQRLIEIYSALLAPGRNVKKWDTEQ